ncbi:hypothetical protein [Streptosporangium sp. NPDC049376]|uniref:hypothetical protein n=1 Tax=Streptosporangium sp. NPDC049376 TaxID=3366192 RepID=UPI0037B72F74
MRRAIGVTASVLLAAVLFPNAAEASEARIETTVELWSQPNLVGDREPVPVPEIPYDEEEQCVQLETLFYTRSARNNSREYIAELYATSECTGTPLEFLQPSTSLSFPRHHDVGSIMFRRAHQEI